MDNALNDFLNEINQLVPPKEASCGKLLIFIIYSVSASLCEVIVNVYFLFSLLEVNILIEV